MLSSLAYNQEFDLNFIKDSFLEIDDIDIFMDIVKQISKVRNMGDINGSMYQSRLQLLTNMIIKKSSINYEDLERKFKDLTCLTEVHTNQIDDEIGNDNEF